MKRLFENLDAEMTNYIEVAEPSVRPQSERPMKRCNSSNGRLIVVGLESEGKEFLQVYVCNRGSSPLLKGVLHFRQTMRNGKTVELETRNPSTLQPDDIGELSLRVEPRCKYLDFITYRDAAEHTYPACGRLTSGFWGWKISGAKIL
jgi:hypothetical protein